MGKIYDSDRIKNKTTELFTKLKNTIIDPYTQAEIENAHQDLLAEIEAETTFITIDYLTRQRFMYFLGGYLVVHDERKAWYYYHAVMLIFAMEEVEDLIKKRYGKEYTRLKHNLTHYGALLTKIKYHLDYMDEKKLKEGDITNPVYQKTMNLLEQFPLIYQELDHIFLIISLYTNLGQQTVPNQAIATFTQHYKRIQYDSEQRRGRSDIPSPEGS
jgi:hypothetical protein